MRFASLLSAGITTMKVINPLDWKLANCRIPKLHPCVVVSNLAFRSEIAGSNPVFVKLCSLFNFLKISQKEVKK